MKAAAEAAKPSTSNDCFMVILLIAPLQKGVIII